MSHIKAKGHLDPHDEGKFFSRCDMVNMARRSRDLFTISNREVGYQEVGYQITNLLITYLSVAGRSVI